MPDSPVLQRLLLIRDRSLPFFDLELAEGKADDPLDLCLLGPNGVGKSALLARLHEAVSGISLAPASDEGYSLAKFAHADESLYLARCFGSGERLLLRPSIESTAAWETLASGPPPFAELAKALADHHLPESEADLSFGPVLWFDPERCLVDGVETASLDDFLSTHLHAREEAFARFLRAPENREKTVAQVERDFEAHSAHALPRLREVWTELLRPSALGVEFGREGGPFFDGAGMSASPSRLGRALRRLLLQTGLAFTRLSEDGEAPALIFLDGPEEGLHPDLVNGLVPLFRSLPGVAPPRLFVTTHSPLVAAHFIPEQCLRLAPDPAGATPFASGDAPEEAAAPESRRPNLKRAIRESDDEDELADLIDEVISFPKS